MPNGTLYPAYRDVFNADGTPVLEKSGDVHLQRRIPIGHREYIVQPIGAVSALVSDAWFNLATGWSKASGHVWFMGTSGGKPIYLAEYEFDLTVNARMSWKLPDNTDQVGVELRPHADPVAWGIELKARP